MEISNLSDAEFKTLALRMLKELSEDLKSIKQIPSETNDSLLEIKNNSEGNNRIVNEANNQINDLEHKEEKNKQSEQEEEKGIQNSKDSVSSLSDNLKHPNICIIGVPEKEKEQKIGNPFEKIMKKIP